MYTDGSLHFHKIWNYVTKDGHGYSYSCNRSARKKYIKGGTLFVKIEEKVS